MSESKYTVGGYLANYIEHIGVRDYFAVPGDFNLLLLDELLKNKNINYVGCCNELNAAYASDGYARAKGVSVVVVTFSVGALSIVNAIAGAYAEDLPVIVISGGPNTNSQPEGELIHHSLGEVRYDYVRKIFSEITSEAVSIQRADAAPRQIHNAIQTCIHKRKPVYIEIPCNIVALETSGPHFPSQAILYRPPMTDPGNLSAAVAHAAEILNAAARPVIIGGSKYKSIWAAERHKKVSAFNKLVDSTQYAVALMADAKGLFNDGSSSNMGTYWGKVSIPAVVQDMVESAADAYIFVGPTFSDYSTTGHSLKLNHKKLIQVDPYCVQIDGQLYMDVDICDFLLALAPLLKPNPALLDEFHKIKKSNPEKIHKVTNFLRPETKEPGDPVTMSRVISRVQSLILDAKPQKSYAFIAETGDSWFSGLKLTLPEGSTFHVQMQYGSIGWSVGAVLGYSTATAGPKMNDAGERDLSKQGSRVVAFIGDGSFQLTAQELATMIRYRTNPIIFLLNNHGYTIEEEIHAGPYNKIQNWLYHELPRVLGATADGKASGNGLGLHVKTNAELDDAIQKALAFTQGPSLIEIDVPWDDCSKELEIWGRAVSEVNGRAPRI